MGKKSGYLDSVDAALRLLQVLGRKGEVRVTDVAADLDVAASTAHRLLSTLRFRGFAVQGSDRVYRPGPAFAELAASRASLIDLPGVARPHLDWLRTATDETSHLVVLIGRDVHFLVSVEARRALRVGSRAGSVLPAQRTSGGKALLAELPAHEVDTLFGAAGNGSGPLTAAAAAAVQAELATTRQRGYGLNVEETEEGIAAVGVAVHGTCGRPLAAVSVSVPTVRFSAERVDELVGAVREAARRIDADLADR